MLLKAEAFYSLPRLPETTLYMKRSPRVLQFYILQGYPYRKETFIPEKKFYTQKAKRSLSTSNYPTVHIHVCYKTFQRHFSLQSFQTFSNSRQFYMHPGIPPYYSILQLECIFYTSTGLHRNSTEYQLRHYKLPTSSKKGRCCSLGYFQ